MFAFYDMNAGKNIINALNVRVLWYERGEKYHKCLDFPDFMIQECLQNIINHVGFAICDTKSTEYLKTPKINHLRYRSQIRRGRGGKWRCQPYQSPRVCAPKARKVRSWVSLKSAWWGYTPLKPSGHHLIKATPSKPTHNTLIIAHSPTFLPDICR